MKRVIIFFSVLQLIAYTVLLLSLFLDAPFLAEIPFPAKGLAFIVLIAAVFSGLNQLLTAAVQTYERTAETKIPIEPFGARDSAEQLTTVLRDYERTINNRNKRY